MSTPSILGLDGSALARPMVPESNPSALPWEVTQWRLKYERAGLTAWALVTNLRSDDSTFQPWQAACIGPRGATLRRSFDNDEEARAAVEEHIAAQIEAHLSEVTR